MPPRFYLLLLPLLWGCQAGVPATPSFGLGPNPEASIAQGAYRIGPLLQSGERSPLAPAEAGTARPVVTGVTKGRLVLPRTTTQLAVFDATDGRELDAGPLPAWRGPAAPRISADGRWLVYLGLTDLVVWDLVTRTRLLLPELEAGEQREPDVDGSGAHLIYLTGTRQTPGLAVFDLAHGRERVLPIPASQLIGARTPTLSADGKRAAYVAAGKRGDDDLFLLDVETCRPIAPPTLNGPDQDTDPALSPDGRVVLFASDRAGSFDLYAYDLTRASFLDMGSFNSLADESQPRLLGPSGDGVAYVSTREGEPRAYVRPLAAWR